MVRECVDSEGELEEMLVKIYIKKMPLKGEEWFQDKTSIVNIVVNLVVYS